MQIAEGGKKAEGRWKAFEKSHPPGLVASQMNHRLRNIPTANNNKNMSKEAP
jgi:hypothetical protein